MRRLLTSILLCGAPVASAQPPKVGCTPVESAPVAAEELQSRHGPLLRGEGTAVPRLAGTPGVTWDLGEERTARLSVYLTRLCVLGLTTSLGPGGNNSTTELDRAVEDFSRRLGSHAPDWSLSVEPPNTIRLAREGKSYSTDLRRLLQARLEAGTPLLLNGVPIRAVYDGFLLLLVPPDSRRSLNLSARSSAYPWAYYDLTPYGLPRLVARFDEDGAALWALP